jgi:hypothetical protein
MDCRQSLLPSEQNSVAGNRPTPGEAPFKGLQFFDEDDSDLFFGREVLTAKLIHRLQDANFLSVIIGASGSGKSSLVRAGLVPAIKKGGALTNGTKLPQGSASWQFHIITPTAHPLEALAIELTRESESVTPRQLWWTISRKTRAVFTFSYPVTPGLATHLSLSTPCW